MKILQVESVGGASGDMILGALADLGVDLSQVEATLQSLAPDPIHFHVDPAESHGLHGTRVTVHAHDHEGDHDHPHGNEDKSHIHGHGPHRGLREITEMIEATALPETVRDQSLAVFRRIAEAEAEVHRIDVQHIHFHEVGALDSIADIVGGCLALSLLDVGKVVVGPLPVGRGTVVCAHGEYPAPAPATLLLLKNYPLVQTDEPFELVTPTGAALLSEWKTDHAPPAGSRVVRVGYGFGHRVLNTRPNVLRAMLLEADEGAESDVCMVMECNVDDGNPELIGVLTESLLAVGALDVFTTAVQMKKQRPGTLVTVLCRRRDRDAMLDLLFRESTTFGVRHYEVDRATLPRCTEMVSTEFGDVGVKVGTWKGSQVTRSPEMDDCRARAQEHGVSVRAVYDAALRSS